MRSSQKQLRRILIEKHWYLWYVNIFDACHVDLRVFSANKHLHHSTLHVRIRFDDPWLNYGPLITGDPERIRQAFVLTPVVSHTVRAIILAAHEQGWHPEQGKGEWQARWDHEKNLLLNENLS
jgi:hypothetical protein